MKLSPGPRGDDSSLSSSAANTTEQDITTVLCDAYKCNTNQIENIGSILLLNAINTILIWLKLVGQALDHITRTNESSIKTQTSSMFKKYMGLYFQYKFLINIYHKSKDSYSFSQPSHDCAIG